MSDGQRDDDAAFLADEDRSGRVIASVSVFSDVEIEELEQYYAAAERADSPGFMYQVGTIHFEEPGWEQRAVALEGALNTLLDRLDSVPREALHREAAFVRLYMTFARGAETISAGVVRRLADVNATIWVDA